MPTLAESQAPAAHYQTSFPARCDKPPAQPMPPPPLIAKLGNVFVSHTPFILFNMSITNNQNEPGTTEPAPPIRQAFPFNNCEWVSRDRYSLPFGWEEACLLGSAQETGRRMPLGEILEVLLSPDTVYISDDGRWDKDYVVTYHAYGPTKEDQHHVIFGDHLTLPTGKIFHACHKLCKESLPPELARAATGYTGRLSAKGCNKDGTER